MAHGVSSRSLYIQDLSGQLQGPFDENQIQEILTKTQVSKIFDSDKNEWIEAHQFKPLKKNTTQVKIPPRPVELKNFHIYEENQATQNIDYFSLIGSLNKSKTPQNVKPAISDSINYQEVKNFLNFNYKKTALFASLSIIAVSIILVTKNYTSNKREIASTTKKQEEERKTKDTFLDTKNKNNETQEKLKLPAHSDLGSGKNKIQTSSGSVGSLKANALTSPNFVQEPNPNHQNNIQNYQTQNNQPSVPHFTPPQEAAPLPPPQLPENFQANDYNNSYNNDPYRDPANYNYVNGQAPDNQYQNNDPYNNNNGVMPPNFTPPPPPEPPSNNPNDATPPPYSGF
jgi:hypothetical protein